MPEESIKKRAVRRYEALKRNREGVDKLYRSIASNFTPRRYRFHENRKLSEEGWNDEMINSTPRQAVRVLVSMFMTAHASPARRWLNLAIRDPELSESSVVKQWLHDVEDWMLEVLQRSNFYTESPYVYEDVATFGTSLMIVEEHPDEVIRVHVPLVGTYSIAENEDGVVDTVYRDVTMTVEGVVRKFGYEACSLQTRMLYDRGALDEEVDLVHVIEPRDTYDLSKPAEKTSRPWRSLWFEKKSNEDEILLESGYHERPHLVPRWSVAAGEHWGLGQAVEALNDAKSLQILTKLRARMAHQISEPPIKVPASMSRSEVSLDPGSITYVPLSDNDAVQPMLTVPPEAIGIITEDIREHEYRIRSALYADQVLAMQLGVQTRQPLTAREVDERHSEKMQQLGAPILRLDREFLAPLVDRLFAIGLRTGKMPEVPEEVRIAAQNKPIPIQAEFVSPMHQAMKLLGYTNLQELLVVTQQIAAVDPAVVDKINTDRMLDTAADILGVDPSVVHSNEAVAEIRRRRAELQAQAQQLQLAREAAAAAKDISAAGSGGQVGELVSNVSPVAGGVQ